MLEALLCFVQRFFGPLTLQLFSAFPTIVQLRTRSAGDVVEYRGLKAAPEPRTGEEHFGSRVG